MEKMMDRREFLKLTARAGSGIVATGGIGLWLASRSEKPTPKVEISESMDFRIPESPDLPELASAKGDSPAQLTQTVINALGGINRFISKGDIVVIKPNIGWDRIPQQAANTNPDVVKKTVELCYSAGAKKVIVTDVSCNDPRRCFARSGIAISAEEAGAEVQLPEDRKFRRINMGGVVLKNWPIYTQFLEADKIINIPILKHHNLTRLTIGMKNWYGIIGGIRSQLHQDIHNSIADLAQFIRPTLVILDAFRVIFTNGPQGGSPKDVKNLNIIAAGTDQVAIDAYGAYIFGINPEELQFIKIANQRGIGKMNINEINIKNLVV
jgi:uncharacterized protein (DUF362 family)